MYNLKFKSDKKIFMEFESLIEIFLSVLRRMSVFKGEHILRQTLSEYFIPYDSWECLTFYNIKRLDYCKMAICKFLFDEWRDKEIDRVCFLIDESLNFLLAKTKMLLEEEVFSEEMSLLRTFTPNFLRDYFTKLNKNC